MKKVNLSLSLERFNLKSSEMKNIKGGGSCTYTSDSNDYKEADISRARAEHLQSLLGGTVVC